MSIAPSEWVFEDRVSNVVLQTGGIVLAGTSGEQSILSLPLKEIRRGQGWPALCTLCSALCQSILR